MKTGDIVQSFSAPDQHGVTRTLEELLTAGPIVLFFYPKAFTSGCTKETCHFRDLNGDFAAVGAQAVGVSADTVEKQASFAEANSLPMILLSDTNKALAKQFGVKRPGPLFNKRATFVIGQDGVLLAEIASELNMETHADKALEILRAH